MSNSTISQSRKAKKEFSHPIIDILMERCQKQDLVEILHCNEREARQIVSECAMHYPIITYSASGVGYRRAKPIDSLTAEELKQEMFEVNKAINDYKERAKSLHKRMKPLIAYLKVAEKRLNGNGNK